MASQTRPEAKAKSFGQNIETDLALEFLRVVENAAISSARTMGQGDRKLADQVATEAMRTTMDTVPMQGTIVIGEGERDEAPMLYIGEKVGASFPDGTEVKILNVIDDHSRLLVASTAMTTCTGAAALAVVADAAATLGWPARFQSDNASIFRHVLADALRPLGVAAAHSRPQHPQTNGKVERFHQTEHKWLAAHEPVDTIADLQTLLDLFRHYYNHHRRHRGIGRHVPADVWTNAPKAGPADRPLRPPSTVHRARVINGVVGIYSYAITVGTVHTGNDTLTVITGTTCHVFIDGRLVRQLTLDPTRRVQPLHTRRLP